MEKTIRWHFHRWTLWSPILADGGGNAYQKKTCVKCGKVVVEFV
jgi:hypothetical protein